MRLNGKRALVTGASGDRNIGQAIARRFAKEGAQVVVAGRREAPLAALAREVGGHHAIFDIERDGEAERLLERTIDLLGGLDILVNAVGGGSVGPFLKTERAQLEWMTNLQFIGPYQLLQAALKRMADGGAIVHISSVGAVRVIEDQAAYTATKAGFDHVIRLVANEFGARGIRVNSLSPGLTDTPLSREVLKHPGFVDAFTRNYPLGRLGTGDEVAAAAVYLASDECFVTGENLQVNGGVTLRRLPSSAEISAAFT
jgi:2-hydroxycyclohexanecarboxyl-CoA dehydrogenase